MPALPPGVWPLDKIRNAVADELPELPATEVERRATAVYRFMWRDADRWYASGKRNVRIKGLFYEISKPSAGRLRHVG
ncbi:MAG: hypothetical protein GF399_11980 [Candidatus Coatesbacteria bacterium]|nr:hypothetical protein [Candidatus Coatesbacteria bacterium]